MISTLSRVKTEDLLMTDSNSNVYSHSGNLGQGLLIVPVGGFFAAVFLSIIYAHVLVYSPIAGYISLLFVVLFAIALGWTISKLGYLAECRNPAFLLSVGLACGFVALYSSWAAFIYVLCNEAQLKVVPSIFEVFLSPGLVFDVAVQINRIGWYSIFGGFTPTGTVAAIFWVIEAIIIVGCSAGFAATAIDVEIFCENCNKWCHHNTDALRLSFPEDGAALNELQPTNLTSLISLKPVNLSESNCLSVDLWECHLCKNLAALKIKTCVIIDDENGKPKEKTEDLTEIWLVTPDDLANIKALAGEPPAQPDEFE